MEKKINIAKILKNVPIGTKLYSPLFGDVFLKYIKYIGEIFITVRHHGIIANFYYNGRLYDYEGTEPMLYPSREMHDWSKFTWKKGDTLSCGVDNLCIFKKWTNKEYTEFYAKFVTPNYNGNTFKTEEWSKETNEAVIKQYISNIEEFKGGKLNLTTLEIEKSQPEFKDGDIVFMKGIKSELFANCIFILKGEYKDGDERVFYYAFYNADNKFTEAEYGNTKVHYSLRSATDSEKQQLFSALAKVGKTWNAEKKQIVDLKPNIELKPFDKVLVRDSKSDNWRANLFGYIDKDGYYRCVYANWVYCIPYIGNESLLGTTKDVEG